MAREEPITRVFHDAEDGAWQFHGPAESKREDIAYVCFHRIIDGDRTIEELSDLPLGWSAWRKEVTAAWIRGVTRIWAGTASLRTVVIGILGYYSTCLGP